MPNILDCGHPESPHSDITRGYGIDKHGHKHCYQCCADNDLAEMIKTGRATLYLTDKEITNWPGSLRFAVEYRKTGHHNIARKRYDAWFSVNGEHWHGVQYGDMTQIIHCRRIKH